MIVGSNKRVAQIPGIANFLGTARYYVASGNGGPEGSSLMSFFAVGCVERFKSLGSDERYFARSNTVNRGWGIFRTWNSGQLFARVGNSTPAGVTSASVPTNPGQMYLALATYNDGTIKLWANAVSAGAAVTLGSGYSPVVDNTSIGLGTPDSSVHEAGMLDGVDLSADAVSISRQWMEDLQQGRALTWPRTPAANSDWYWSARDAVAGGQIISPWVDRYSSVPLGATGVPQGVTLPARFAP